MSRWTTVGLRLRCGFLWVRVSPCRVHWRSGSWRPVLHGSSTKATARTAVCTASRLLFGTVEISTFTCSSPLRDAWDTAHRVCQGRGILRYMGLMTVKVSRHRNETHSADIVSLFKEVKICPSVTEKWKHAIVTLGNVGFQIFHRKTAKRQCVLLCERWWLRTLHAASALLMVRWSLWVPLEVCLTFTVFSTQIWINRMFKR